MDSIDLAERSPEPYDLVLRQIDICDASGPLKVAIDGRSVVLMGDDDARVLLARHIDFLVGHCDPDDEGAHLHLEWFPGNDFVSEDSEPLLIVFEQA